MEYKIFYFFSFLFASISINSAVSSPKYEKISSCDSSGQYCTGCRFAEFSCGDINGENSILDYETVGCNDRSYYRYRCGTINFKSCRFHQIDSVFFEIFESLHTFNISDVELEILQPNVFDKARNLTHLIASQNRLKEIPSLLFVNANKLTYVDISNNTIERIDPLAFVGANNIEILDMSRNKITELSEQFKDLTNLKTLNLSYNEIKEIHLNEHSFNQTTKLKDLNLSFNSIGNLKVETFAYIPNLEHLNLRRTNISSIKLGTFSNQHKLVLLDLSENLLKELDFKLFFPILQDLQTLRLGGNQLTHLNGFRNALFPQLNLLDITENRFNCSYLHHFMENVNWEHLHLHLAPHSSKAGETNIRGIRCNDKLYELTDSEANTEVQNKYPDENNSLENVSKETLSKLNPKSNDDIFTIKIVSSFMLVILTAFFIIFLVLNFDRIRNQCIRFKFTHERPVSVSVTYNTERAESLLL